jgi:hypothetical protein
LCHIRAQGIKVAYDRDENKKNEKGQVREKALIRCHANKMA